MSDDDDTGPPDDEIREALRRLRGVDGEDEPTQDDVVTLWNAWPYRAVKMLPDAAAHAIMAMLETQRDVNNGGMDQVVWNHGAAQARAYAEAWREVGMVDNADLLVRLADALEGYFAQHGEEAIMADLVHHFIAWRKSVGGPAFGIPEPSEEMAEPLLEYVIDRASELPDPDGELPLKSPDPGAGAS